MNPNEITAENVYRLLKESYITPHHDKEAYLLIEEICKRFILIPSEDFSSRANVFHNLALGFFQERLTHEELSIYNTLWAAQVEAWKAITDDPMGALEIMALDNTIMLYIKTLRLSGAKMELDITAGSAGWVADQLLQKAAKLLYDIFPKRKASVAAKEKESKLSEEKDDAERLEEAPRKELYYIWKEKEMTASEYEKWYGSLSEKEKANVLPHIKMIEK